MTTMASVTLRLTRDVVERLEREAGRAGLSLEEYVLELILRGLDPSERAREYVKVAEDLLRQARGELSKGDVRQAAEKVWGAAALSVKAYAEWREGRRLAGHGELWEYRRRSERELGEWVYGAWMAANGMHVCFYEGWCSKEDVERAVRSVERLVKEVAKRVGVQPPQ